MRRMEKFLTGFTSSVARSPESAGVGGAYLLRWPIISVHGASAFSRLVLLVWVVKRPGLIQIELTVVSDS